MEKQYEIAFNYWDSEANRFWTRFNLFLGFQFIILAGIATNLSDFFDYKFIASTFIIIGVLFSLFHTITIRRSYSIHKTFEKVVAEIEKENEKFRLLEMYNKYADSKIGDIMKLSFFMSLVLTVFWISLFCYAMIKS